MTQATCPHCGSFMRDLLDIPKPDEQELIAAAMKAGENSPEEEALTQYYESIGMDRSDAQGCAMILFMPSHNPR